MVFVLAPFVVQIAFGPEYVGAVTPLRILLLGEAGIAIFYLDGACLAGTNRLRSLASAAVIGLAVVTVLDVALIPHFGLEGAAWASVVMGAAAVLLLRRDPYLSASK
jgi:O-antigen/teichoic acid export membrane protein